MHVGTSLKSFAGAVAIYVIMAACSSGPADTGYLNPPHGDGGGGAGGGADSSAAADGVSGSLLDALTDPVPDAKADSNTSGTRLKARRYVGEDGSSQFIGWHDSQRGEECGFSTALDGTLRCLPQTAGTGDYFSDGNCTNAVKLALVFHGCEPPKYALAATKAATCAVSSNGTSQIYSVAAKASDAFVKAGTSCVSQINASFDFYGVGAVIPPTSFVAAQVTTD